MSRKILPYLIIGLLLCCIISCESVSEVEPYTPEYNDVVFLKIEQLMNQNDPERVLHIINSLSLYAENDGLYMEKIKSIRQPATEKLIEKLDEAIGLKEYLEAAEIVKSIMAAGLSTDYKLETMYLKYVIKNIADGNITPALAEFQDRIITSESGLNLTDEEAELIFDAAVVSRNRAVLSYLKRNSQWLNGERKEIIDNIIDEKISTNLMISGTVTVHVNRGIKLERGMGYPDRVIGSGFYIDQRGYILTNYHVISSEVDPEYEGFSRLYVKFDEDDSKIPAEVVGWDASLDIALLKVEYQPEFIYGFPLDREYIPGEEIYAIGSPGGLAKTITSGIISASADRRLLPLGDTIQVDVPINSGNSGGPVIDKSGNLIGVVFAGIEQFEGVNFIIPAKWIRHSISELYKPGKNRQSWLGLTVHESREGLEVLYVMPDTSCYKAGIRQGDKILSIDGQAVLMIEEAQEIVLRKRPGTLLQMVVNSDSVEYSHLLVVEERADLPMKKALEIDSRKNLLPSFFGMRVETGEQTFFNQDYIITEIYQGMSADEIGLSVNDPFTLVNWQIDKEQEIIIARLRIKKRKAGFLKSEIQMGNKIDITNTI
ncbi:MAG: trypsin-like peptidase domain-containing protein [Spirochaetales bacterium]|nr:trypsin-like peptidase domain-containing protein [Spirochaetales bacterium]